MTSTVALRTMLRTDADERKRKAAWDTYLTDHLFGDSRWSTRVLGAGGLRTRLGLRGHVFSLAEPTLEVRSQPDSPGLSGSGPRVPFTFWKTGLRLLAARDSRAAPPQSSDPWPQPRGSSGIHAPDAPPEAAWQGLRTVGPFICDNGWLQIVQMRNRMAKKLGYADFYDYKVTQSEGFSKAKLFSILDGLEQETRPLLEKAIEEVKRLKGEEMLGNRGVGGGLSL